MVKLISVARIIGLISHGKGERSGLLLKFSEGGWEDCVRVPCRGPYGIECLQSNIDEDYWLWIGEGSIRLPPKRTHTPNADARGRLNEICICAMEFVDSEGGGYELGINSMCPRANAASAADLAPSLRILTSPEIPRACISAIIRITEGFLSTSSML